MAWQDEVRTGLKWPALAGAVTLAVAFGGFGTWAAVAPLQGAIVAAGKLAHDGGNKPVEHLEGGVVQQVLVEEGQHVSSGDPVVILDKTAAEATLNRLKIQLMTLSAAEARLEAERSGAEAIAFPPELLAEAATPAIATVLDDQETEFRVRKETHQTEISAVEQQIASHQEVIKGHRTELEEIKNQIELIGDERQALEQLWEKRLTTKSRLSEVRRAEADLRGREGRVIAAIAEAERSIAKLGEQIRGAASARAQDASAQLSDVRLKRSDVLEQIRAAEEVTGRTIVRAPISGKVINLAKHNLGAVIAPGEAIMSIVPDGTGMIVEAHISPQDVDEVRIGQDARVTFGSDPRQAPSIAGKVVHVSADRLEDERTGAAYYLAKIGMSYPSGSAAGLAMQPGQPVEVFITTGDRTFAEYLAEPLLRSLDRSLRE